MGPPHDCSSVAGMQATPHELFGAALVLREA
jgi:hypothetical protein